MNEEQRRAAIPALDELTDQAHSLDKELNAVIQNQSLTQQDYTTPILNTSYRLVSELRQASDALKRLGTARIQSFVTRWSHLRQDDEDNALPDPAFDSIHYDGENVWTVVMTTSTHGKERLVVHSDAATWNDVYSATRV
jgi:hypothetical protein